MAVHIDEFIPAVAARPGYPADVADFPAFLKLYDRYISYGETLAKRVRNAEDAYGSLKNRDSKTADFYSNFTYVAQEMETLVGYFKRASKVLTRVSRKEMTASNQKLGGRTPAEVAADVRDIFHYLDRRVEKVGSRFPDSPDPMSKAKHWVDDNILELKDPLNPKGTVIGRLKKLVGDLEAAYPQ